MRILFFVLLVVTQFSATAQLFGDRIAVNNTTSSPSDFDLVDIDNDSDLDIVCALKDNNSVALYLNEGNGISYNKELVSEDLNHVREIHTVDLNSDGLIDILAAYYGGVCWFANLGNGQFSGKISISNNGPWNGVNSADIDGDGDLDVVSNSLYSIYWFENEGLGDFVNEHLISTEIGLCYALFPTDLDEDDNTDILLADYSTIKKIINTGGGEFADPTALSELDISAATIDAVDIDNDGHIDIVCPTAWDDLFGIYFFHNNGNNQYDATLLTGELDQIKYTFPSDLDNDGDIDILVSSDDDNKISFFENLGNNEFSTQQTVTTEGDGPSCIKAGDMDGDGLVDIVAASISNDEVSVRLNLGEGFFGNKVTVDKSQNNGAQNIQIADLEGDGDLDILSSDVIDGKVAWHINDGAGNFTHQIIGPDGEINVENSIAYDFDLDGDLDVITSSIEFSSFGWENQIKLHSNQGDNLTYEQTILSADIGLPIYYTGGNRIEAADMDNDGIVDIVASIQYLNKIIWFKNLGDGNFASPQEITNISAPITRFTLGDIDADNDIDVFFISTGDMDSLTWIENTGAGNFGEGTTINWANYVLSTHLADLDSDGDLDVVVGEGANYDLAWFRNDGSGNLGSKIQITDELANINSIETADLDGDNDLDLVIGSSHENLIVWLENYGGGTFGIPQVIDSAWEILNEVLLADIDLDGHTDVITVSQNADKISWYSNLAGYGCSDQAACNYEPSALFLDDSCCYEECGCTSPLAQNYVESAVCDDETCEFRISGVVFYDENEDGLLNNLEYGLPFQTITIEPQGLTLITNDFGEYEFSLAEYDCLLTLLPNEMFPFHTTPQAVYFDQGNSQSTTFNFGISNEIVDFAVCVDLYPNGNGFLCDDVANHNICFRNMGNVPINGIVEVQYDSLFQGHIEVTPLDSVNGSTVYMSFQDLIPGEMYFYDLELLTPTVDHIGEYITSIARITGYYEDEQVASGEKELTMEVTCAYDPNDKQAFPLGYTEDHLVLQETEQEFLIRFQNTGNAPAQNIRIQDTLDLNYDLSTFKLMANSHSVFTTINENTRVVDFFFENILLPDSTNNEPDSHGMISYKIKPFPDLEAGTVLNNAAFIYFDNNLPIVTNTTWTNIHECGGEASFDISFPGYCIGEPITWTSTYPWVEDYYWMINGVEGDESVFTAALPDSGEYELFFAATNSLCDQSMSHLVSLSEAPQAEIRESGIALIANEGYAYQWLLNDEEIEGANNQVFLPSAAGMYNVMVTTSNNCSTLSAPVNYSLLDLGDVELLIYPNPVNEVAILAFKNDNQRDVRLLDANGKLVKLWSNIEVYSLSLKREGLAAGKYIIQVIEEEHSYTEQLVIY